MPFNLAFTTRPEIQGQFGVVSSTHWLASSVGMAVLEKGGNAFDAAVACGFALQIVEPHLNGPGGDLPAIFYAVSDGRPRVLCAQGPSPALATIEHFEGLGLSLIPGSGLLPAVVPGAFDGWLRLLSDYGTMRLRDVLHYAIGYAENGVPVLPKIADTIARVQNVFNEHWSTSAAVFLNQGNVPEVGSWFTNQTLADTYRRLLDEAEAAGGSREREISAARRAWYDGWVAEAIGRFYTTEEVLDPTGQRNRGLLRADDLSRWSATYEDPVSIQYGRYTVCKCGFWSQGPVLLQQLAMLRGRSIDEMDPTGPEFVHTVTEVAKLAYADREAWYADPDFAAVPQETLLSDAYAAERAALVGNDASPELRPGSPDGLVPNLAPAFRAQETPAVAHGDFGTGEPTVQPMRARQGDTVHIDIIDQYGNMISATPSGGWLQSAPAIPELGFPMGIRGQMFWLDDSVPNALAPGKRPRTTLSPSLALRDGEPYMVWGTPGGDQQDQWSTLMFLHHVEHGQNLQEAIDCPAFHSEHFPSSFFPRGSKPKRLVVEGRFPEATVADLVERGHDVVVGGDWSEGRLTGARRDGRILMAGANPRGMQGYAVGR